MALALAKRLDVVCDRDRAKLPGADAARRGWIGYVEQQKGHRAKGGLYQVAPVADLEQADLAAAADAGRHKGQRLQATRGQIERRGCSQPCGSSWASSSSSGPV